MEKGKLSERILERSVLKQLQGQKGLEGILTKMAAGGDFAALNMEEEEALVTAVASVSSDIEDIGRLAVIKASNNVAVSGADQAGIMLDILLPPDTEESRLKFLIKQAALTAKELETVIIGGHTEITDSVRLPVITATGIGRVKRSMLLGKGSSRPGDDIVMTKWIGLEGSAFIVKERKEELKARFTPALIESLEDMSKELSIIKEARICRENMVHEMHDLSSGGVFAGLWELSKASGLGLVADLKKIDIRQETVELCEYFKINPYELKSSGSLLFTTDRGYEVVERLKEAKIRATVIGKLTDNKDRIIVNEDEERYLDSPRGDEWDKVMTGG
ncbi:MAG: hydrogenase maturation factor [Lachnospiraceae bacterium]|nr:hydrogenase maturation factor [Lachnospiraceae bacterium]